MADFDVVDLGPTDHLAEGESAPDFTRPLVTTEGWTDRSLSAVAESGPVVLVFTSMAGAFIAEYTLTELRDRGIGAAVRAEEADEGTSPADRLGEPTVVALSISSPYELAPFLREHDLPYGVFSDPSNEIAERYGVVHDLDGMTGIAEPRPAIFVLDGDRRVEYVWVATEWPDFPDYDDLEAVLAEDRSP